MRTNALMRISRNIAIVRHGGKLRLVNPIRLSAAREDQLRRLGVVKRMVRLGALSFTFSCCGLTTSTPNASSEHYRERDDGSEEDEH
jgi:hypothetical protein